MASPMIPPDSAPDFLARNGWGGACIEPLAGDASFRRYFRVLRNGEQAVLMDAPPAHEDVRPFLTIADHLADHGFRAPRILARDVARGLLLLEDFGDRRVGPVLAQDPAPERAIYRQAIDTLVALRPLPLPAVAPYDEAALLREIELFSDWYAPALGLVIDRAAYLDAWRSAWGGLLESKKWGLPLEAVRVVAMGAAVAFWVPAALPLIIGWLAVSVLWLGKVQLGGQPLRQVAR